MRVLIVKSSSLGDIVHTFPVVAYLRDRFPNVEVDWVVEAPFRGLIDAHPHVKRTLAIDTKRWRRKPWKYWKEIASLRRALREVTYDVLFDLQGNTKSALFTLMTKARHKVGFARASVPEWPNLLVTKKRFDPPAGGQISEDYLAIVRSFFRDGRPYQPQGIELHRDQPLPAFDLPRPWVLVCPGSAWRNKQLTPEALLSFCRLTGDAYGYHFLWLWGNEEEHLLAQRMHRAFPDTSAIVPKLSLPTLQRLMAEVDRVFAVDSLALHLCATTHTPSYSLFGPSLAAKYTPPGHHSLQGSCPYKRTFDKRCPILRTCDTGLCIRGLTGQEIFDHYQTVV